MGWGSMNNVKPRITPNPYEMRLFPPQHCFKKENIDSGGVQRFRALGELTFCWSMPTLSLHGHKRAWATIPHLISADKAGQGREESLTFAAGSRCCRSAAGSVGFRYQVKPPSLWYISFFPPSYCLRMQIRMDNLFSFLTNFPLFWSVSFIFAGHYLSLITVF